MKLRKPDAFLAMITILVALAAIAIPMQCDMRHDLTGERKYIGKLRRLEVKPGGFMSSSYTVYYCDSAAITVRDIGSSVLGKDCWIIDGRYFYIDGRKTKFEIE